MKLFDFFFWGETTKFIILDSDVLVFDSLEQIENSLSLSGNTFLEDYQHAFCITKAEFQSFASLEAYQRVNSGLAIINRSVLDLALVERFLSTVSYQTRIWWAEQTLFTILSAREGINLLDSSHLVARGPGLEGIRLKHYVWKTRPLAYSEGIPAVRYLLETGRC
jgi:hypothetical protein